MLQRLEVGLRKRLEIERRRIKAQHAMLGELFIDFLSPGGLDPFHFALLRSGLIAHFEMEERVMIPALHGSSPERAPELLQLVEEHKQFLHLLDVIGRAIDRSETNQAVETAVSLMEQLTDHEQREEALYSV